MASDHGGGHGFAGGIKVEAAVEGEILGEEIGQPRGMGSCARGGEAAKMRMQGVATEGVDGRFAENGGVEELLRDGKEPEVLAGARRHAPPGGHGGLPAEARAQTGATKFGPDGLVTAIKQQEHRVGSGVGVEIAGVEEGFQE